MRKQQCPGGIYGRIVWNRILKLAAAACCASSLYALPGVNQYIPDTPGEYVYYRDYTFSRESYTGFLYYNDSTYALRYYAPQNKDRLLPEKSIELLVSVDPKQDHMEMTGERILSSITPDDTDIVNYLHDMMYELTARRKKAGDISPHTGERQNSASFLKTGVSIEQDFMQFGGTVSLLFDYTVPLFNLKTISGRDGKLLFQAVTAGMLKSSADTSFLQFTGIPAELTDCEHEFTYKKDAAALPWSLPEHAEREQPVQHVTLDSEWKHQLENLWLLGNSAIFSMNTIDVPPGQKDLFADRFLARLLLSTENSYSVWDSVDIRKNGGRLAVSSTYYQNKTGNVTRDFKILTKLGESTYGYLTLTVFDSIYRANSNYFDNIIKSYSVSD